MTKIWKMGISPDQFIADTQDLTNEELGVYFRLLCYAWKKEAYLPTDLDRLQRIGQNCEIEIIKYLLQTFFKLDKKGYYCKAQLEEWNWVQEKSNKAKDNADLRWNKERISKRTANYSNSNSNNKIEYTDDFNLVWSKLEVKRGGKKQAFSSYQKLSNPDKDKIINNYNFLISTISDPQYYPHFSSWLNGDRMDEDIHLGEQAIRKLNDLDSNHKYIGFIDNKHKFIYDMGFSKMNVYYDKKGKKINE